MLQALFHWKKARGTSCSSRSAGPIHRTYNSIDGGAYRVIRV
jgi:hypothetical protein